MDLKIVLVPLCFLIVGYIMGLLLAQRKKLTRTNLLKIVFLTPFFVVLSLPIFIYMTIKEDEAKKDKIESIAFFVRHYFRLIPLLSLRFSDGIIEADKKKEKMPTRGDLKWIIALMVSDFNNKPTVVKL